MEKRIKFSDQPLKVKIVYGAVVAVLLITAIVVGIVSVASRNNGTPDAGDNPPPVTDGPTGDVGDGGNDGGAGGDATPDEPTLFSAPVVGSIMKSHSTDTPVFSDTLNEWRIHTGIDIAAEEGDSVCAAGDGVVSKVYNDHFLGKTVEITHAGGLITVYSNLSGDGVTVAEGAKVKCGDKIGVVGDTSLHELADEAHLHFEVRLDGKAVNPLEHISEESKKTAFGIADT